MTASLEIVVGPRRLRGWCYAFIDFLKIEKAQGWRSDGFMPRAASGRAPRPRFPRKIGLLRNGSVLCPAPGLLRQNLAKEEPLEAPHGRNVPVHLVKERRPLLRRNEKAGRVERVEHEGLVVELAFSGLREHRIPVRGAGGRHFLLENVPVLEHLAGLDAEDVHGDHGLWT